MRTPRVWYALVCLLLLFLVGCGGVSAPSGEARDVAPGLYSIDALAPSLEAPRIDMHVRYAERSAGGLVIHLAFYNNGTDDLAFVRGAEPTQARLVASEAEPPAAISPSLQAGIAPEVGWLAGAATNGTLQFARAPGSAFTFTFPGFPSMPIRLDTPLRQAPDPPPAPTGTYTYPYHTQAQQSSELLIERATVSDGAVELVATLSEPESTSSDRSIKVSGAGAVVLDGRWNQYPASVEVAADDAAATSPQPVGTLQGRSRLLLRFQGRPIGDTLLLRLPPFPLLRIPLRAGEEPVWATSLDLPPSTEPRDAPATQTAQPDATVSDRRAIEALLTQLGRSVAARDQQGYLAAFAGELHAEQARIFDRLVSLPLEEMAYMLEPGIALAEGEQTQSVQATLLYRVGDSASGTIFSHDLSLNLLREGGAWRIKDVGGELPFWALGPTVVRRTAAFTIFFRPEAEARLALIEDEVAAALHTVGERLPGRIPAANVMFVTETAEDFAQLTGRDPNRFAGVALSRYQITDAGIAIQGAAFYINGAAFGSDGRQSRQQTIAHELVHLALAGRTMPYTPLWVVEGMAMEVAEELPVETMRAAASAGTLQAFDLAAYTAERSWGVPGETSGETALDYAYAAYLSRFLVERYGFSRFVAFYESFADIPWSDLEGQLLPQRGAVPDSLFGALAHDLAAKQLQATYGLDLAALQQDFLAWLPTQVGG